MADANTLAKEGKESSTSSSENNEQLTPTQELSNKAEAAYQVLKTGEKLPDDTSPEVTLLAKQMKISRDTQSEYTKNRQELVQTKAELKATNAIAMQVAPTLTEEQATELQELKFTDPDKWRELSDSYEDKARQGRATHIKEQSEEQSVAAVQELRLEQLKEFTKESGIVINDDVIENDIPPRITKKLAEGKISFKEFLSEAEGFLTSSKVIDNGDAAQKNKSFDTAAGHQSPENRATQNDYVESYANGELDI